MTSDGILIKEIYQHEGYVPPHILDQIEEQEEYRKSYDSMKFITYLN